MKENPIRRLAALSLPVVMAILVIAMGFPTAAVGLPPTTAAGYGSIETDSQRGAASGESHDSASTGATDESSSSASDPTLEELALHADCVVVATVTDIASQGDAEHGNIHTVVTLSAED